MKKAWIFLFLGTFFEVAGTTGMRALLFSHPMLSQTSATLGIIIAYFCVSRSVETIPMAVAYAIWSGAGIGGTSLLSALLFAEAMPPLKIAGLVLVIWGIAVVNLGRGERHGPEGYGS